MGGPSSGAREVKDTDFDGDGKDDIVVGSENYSEVALAAGAAFLFYGRGL